MPSSIELVQTPRIRVNGTLLRNETYDDIVELRLEQTVSMPSQLTLRLSDPEFTLIDGNLLPVGADVSVDLPTFAGSWIKCFEGTIVSVGADQDFDHVDASELVVTAFDRAQRLGRTTRVRTFQNMTYSDVVRKIALEEGFTDGVQSTTVRFPYLIQTTTNYSFLNELAFRSGYEWSVEGRKLNFAKRSAGQPVTVTYGEDLRRLKARFTSAQETSEVQVRSWDPNTKQAVIASSVTRTVRADRAVTGTAQLGVNGRKLAGSMSGKVATATLTTSVRAEAEELAGALNSRIAAADLTARCVCVGRPDIVAGKMVKIANAGTRLSGEYYVTSVEHRWGRGGDLVTTVNVGGKEPSSLVDLLGGATGQDVSSFGQLGLTIGLVTNNQDPDGLGRVRVKFPHLSDSEESWWARLVSPGAGSGAGLMMVPQINDEVLVGFEQGDLRYPYVLGSLWGPRAKPPTATNVFLEGGTRKVVEWGMATAGGHSLRIRSGQAPADKHFNVALADGTKLYLGSDKVEVISQNKTVELKSGQGSILITANGDVELRGNQIVLKATQGVTIDGGAKLEAKAAVVKAEASGPMTVKGAVTNVEGSGLATLKAAMVQIN